MRIGKPIMWPSDALPTNTLVLDGSELDVGIYWRLFAIYDRIYTSPSVPQNKFCLPDFRGLTPRGVDMAAGRDYDANKRKRDDGSIGDQVGSYQSDNMRRHSHVGASASNSTGSSANKFTSATGSAGAQGGLTPKRTSSTGGTETRCDNIALTFITFYQ